MYKAFHIKLTYNLQNLFLFERTDYEAVARQSGYFTQIYVCTTKKQHCVSVTGIKLWNSIEIYIYNSKTEQAFNTKFKCFLISSYLDIVENANKWKIKEITLYEIQHLWLLILHCANLWLSHMSVCIYCAHAC